MLVVEGTVYPLLTRLKNTGLLAYRWEESTQGPPRKYYNITEQGRQFLQALETSWEELTTAIEILKDTTYTSITNIIEKNIQHQSQRSGILYRRRCLSETPILHRHLESHYLKEEDGREIMADIESRIAELLKEALGKGYKQVVTMEDIDQIIRIMGSPDVIIDEDTVNSTEPIKRKL